MKHIFIIANNKVIIFFLYILYLCALIIPHKLQTTNLEAYRGIQKWDFGVCGYFLLLFCVIMAIFLLSRKKFFPSDFFVVLYFLIVVTSFVTLHSASGYVNDEGLPIPFFILIIPLFALIVFRKVFFMLPQVSIIKGNMLEYLLMLFIFIVVSIAYNYSPLSAGFGIENSYDRRIEGRSIYVAGSFFAYLLSMSINMFTPFFAFYGGLYKKYHFIMLSFILALFFFWLLGIKATFIYIFAAYGIAWLVVNGEINFLSVYVMSIVGILFFIFIIEWLINGYSIVADYFFRRLFSLPSQIQGYYFDFILNNNPDNWNILTGFNDSSLLSAFYVGENYMGNSLTNANTNTYLSVFGNGGLLSYFYSSIIVPLTFALIDNIYLLKKNYTCIFLGFMYAILLLEQVYTTALLSSGITFMAFLIYINRFNKNDKGNVDCTPKTGVTK